MQLFCFKCFLFVILFGQLRNKPITSIYKQWEFRQASVALFVFSVLFSFVLPLPLICGGCAAVESERAAAVRLAVRPARLGRDVLLQVPIPVALGQLGDGAQAVENVVLGCGLVAGALLTVLGPSQPEVIQLGVDALLGGGLVAVGVQAVEDGAVFWGEHVQGQGPLVQAQLTALHAPDGGGSLQLVVNLDAHTPTCLSKLCPNIRLPFCCMSLNATNLGQRK